MKVTLTFDLPEERDDLLLALKAGGLAATLNDIYNAARSQLKHGEAKEDRCVLEDIKAAAWVDEF